MKTRNQILQLAAIAGLAIPANAAVVVTPDHIQGTPTYTVQGTLAAIDAPSGAQTGPDGPDWTETADDGFSLLAGASTADIGAAKLGWEPDGTAAGTSSEGFMLNNALKSVTYAFDLPDGSIVHNVYSTWSWQTNSVGGHTYTDDEGSATFTRETANTSSDADLVLRWTDSALDTHDPKFERIFAGDISVTGGDGYVVTFTQADTTSFPFIDAVVIDYTAIPEPGSLVLLGFSSLGMVLRRRRK